MTDDKQTPPDWVLIEAAKRSMLIYRLEFLRENYSDMSGAYQALCDMIERYEQPPVDRKLLCAEEAMQGWEDGALSVQATCVRAIELHEQGFGK
jgi:hypothetical protein